MFVRTSRVKCFLRGCHRMRFRYRQIVENIERGWRKRFAASERSIEEERKLLMVLLRRLSTIDLESLGNMQYGMRLTFDASMIEMFHSNERDLIRYWAQHAGYMLEQEVMTLNFSRFRDTEYKRQNEEFGRKHRHSPLFP